MSRELEVLELGSKIQDSGAVGDGQDAARLLPAPAAQGHPGRAGRDRRDPGRDQRAARAHRGGPPPRGGRQAGPARARPAGEAPVGGRRVRRDPHLPRLDPLPALERLHRGRSGHHRTPGRSSIATTTTWRTSKTASSSSWPFRSSRRRSPAPSSASSDPPVWARPALGSSIARALGRKFVRISVGGVRDEAEIRGHRRTYIGAMPGTIIRAIRDAESNNPVFMIDEIDKMGADWRGDPSSAMLEVLDPEQHDTLPRPLPRPARSTSRRSCSSPPPTCSTPSRRRCATAWRSSPSPGYTEEEKLHIAKRYLIPRQLERNGLNRGPARDHRRRSPRDHPGLHAGGRRAATWSARSAPSPASSPAWWPRRGAEHLTVDAEKVPDFLGRQKVFRETKRRTERPRGLDRPRLDADRRRHPLHRGPCDAGHRPTDADRPAGRRHEGVGHGRPHVHPQHRRRVGRRRHVLPEARHPRARAGRRRPQGRAVGGRGHHDGPGQHDPAAADRRRGGHDRRDHPDRPGAAGGRDQGEGAGGPAGRASRKVFLPDRNEADFEEINEKISSRT